jgi:hypothetical protein
MNKNRMMRPAVRGEQETARPIPIQVAVRVTKSLLRHLVGGIRVSHEAEKGGLGKEAGV